MILAPALVWLLREQRVASAFDGPEDFVFANAFGRGPNYRRDGNAFRSAFKEGQDGMEGRAGCSFALSARDSPRY